MTPARHPPSHPAQGPADKPLARALVWLRRDLRVDDHAALYHALTQARQVWCCFVFDREILDGPCRGQDRRVEFIRDSLVGVDAELRALAASHGVEGAGLIVRHGWPKDQIPALAAALQVQAVFASHDDEPAALARDALVRGRLSTWAWPCTPARTTWCSSAARCSRSAAAPSACSRPTRTPGSRSSSRFS
jgi:deoxyribodipyrimidine photolyase